ncbi:MAG: porin [Campylobacterales bacterium]
MKFFIAFLFFLSSFLYAQDEYVLGEGYQVGDSPIYLGGYFSVDYRKKDEEDRYRVDDISFMSYGGNDTLSYLAEFEFKEFYVETRDNENSTTERNHKLYIERLYVDYNIDENYNLRLGKYNSPIGFWNLMPINVLRETSSSPILNNIIYPKYTTGLDLSYSTFSQGELKLDFILQDNTAIDDDDYNNYDIDKHYALGISYEEDDYTYKVNGGYFSKRDKQIEISDYTYALISARYDDERYQFLAEAGIQNSKEKDHNYAGYVQGLYRFTYQHIGVIRLESYKDELQNKNDNIAIFGYTYRPLYPVALKAEYQQHSADNENQIIFSFSVLF